MTGATVSSYRAALRPVRERLGAHNLQELTKADVEGLVTWMLTEGRKRGGKAETGVGPRSVRLTLGRLTAALESALAEGLIVRNVAKLVTPPAYEPAERAAWSAAQVRMFKGKTSATRLFAVWVLAFYGLRRGELLGLRWDDVEIRADEVRVSIVRTRTLVEGKIVEGLPKTKSSVRTPPITDVELVTALRRLKATHAADRLACGEGYEAHEGDGYVACDEYGAPLHPERVGEEFKREGMRAGLPRIVLHGTRHTSATLLRGRDEDRPGDARLLQHGPNGEHVHQRVPGAGSCRSRGSRSDRAARTSA